MDSDLIARAKLNKQPGYSDSAIDRRLRSDPTFPRPVMLGNRCFFRKAELTAWEESRKSTHHLKRTGVKAMKVRAAL